MSQVVKTYSNIFYGLVHIFRRRWEAQDRNETKVERGYIVEEARTLFRENKELEDEQEIRLRMMEAEARLTMAEHYGERGRRSLRKMTDLGLVTILRGMIHCILVWSYLQVIRTLALSTCPRPPTPRERGRRWARRSRR